MTREKVEELCEIASEISEKEYPDCPLKYFYDEDLYVNTGRVGAALCSSLYSIDIHTLVNMIKGHGIKINFPICEKL